MDFRFLAPRRLMVAFLILGLTTGIATVVAVNKDEANPAVAVPLPANGDRFTYTGDDGGSASFTVTREVPLVAPDRSVVPSIRFDAAGDAEAEGPADRSYFFTDDGELLARIDARNSTETESRPSGPTGEPSQVSVHQDVRFRSYIDDRRPCGIMSPAQGLALRADATFDGTSMCGPENATFEVVAVERREAQTLAWVDELQEGVRVARAVFADGVPYAIEVVEAPEPHTAWVMTRFSAGDGPAAEAVAAPAGPWATRSVPWGVDDTGVEHPWPISEAWAAMRDDPLDRRFAEFLSTHRDAYVAIAISHSSTTDDRIFHAWFLTVTDGQESVELIAQRMGERPDRREEIAPVWRPVQWDMEPEFRAWPSPDDVPELPTWQTVLALEQQIHGPPEAGYPLLFFYVGCRSDCKDVATSVHAGWTHSDSNFGWRTMILGDAHEWDRTSRRVGVTAEGTLRVATDYSSVESSDAGGEGEAGTFHVASAATRLDGPRPAAVATGIGLSGAILAAMYLLWPLAKQAPVFGLFTRIRRSRALEHPVRKQLHDAIENSPGIHLRELTRLAERGQGAVRHHLQKLEQSGLVRRSEGSGYVCFFPMGATRAQVASAAVVKSPVARRMLQMAAARPGVTAREVADGLGVAPATASYHVKRLREAGLLSGDRDRNRIRLQATRSGCQAAGFLAA